MNPLADVTVLAIEQYGAGPWATLHLADLGADVIKIEDPSSGGDVGRYIPPFQHGEDSLFFESLNRNKRSIGLDISCPAGREVLRDLVAYSDALYANVRGDVPERLGLRYEDLSDANPNLVCCLLSGFGMTGPRRNEPGYDYVIQGLAGWMSMTGDPEGPPQRVGLSLVDFAAGLASALALVVGIHAARRDGVGGTCDMALFDTAISLLNYPAAWHLTGSFEPQRTSSSAHPSIVPFQMFETADDPIMVACAKEKFWTGFVEAIGRPELKDDERFSTFALRDQHREHLLTILRATLLTRGAEHWLRILNTRGIPSGPVNSVGAALRDPQVTARGLIVETEHSHFGTVRQVATPVNVGEIDIEHRRAPRRGEHDGEILGGLLGYGQQQIDRLRDRGAFGAPGDAPAT